MAYTAWSVVFGEQPTAAKWNELGANDASFHDGSGILAFDKARVTKSANQSLTDSTETSITWNQEDFDTNSMHDNSSNTNRITIATSGTYLLSGVLNFAGAATDATGRSCWVYRDNGDPLVGNLTVQQAATSDCQLNFAGIYNLTAGQWVEVKAFQSSGGSLNVLSARSHFSVTRIA